MPEPVSKAPRSDSQPLTAETGPELHRCDSEALEARDTRFVLEGFGKGALVEVCGLAATVSLICDSNERMVATIARMRTGRP